MRKCARPISLSRRTLAQRCWTLIGGDRLASRNEIRKLALYAKGQKSVELADVMAVVADASQIALDGLIDAVFAGRTAEADSRVRQSAGKRLVSADNRFGSNPPGRQFAQNEAGHRRRRFSRVCDEARCATCTLFSRTSGQRSAARLDATTPDPRYGAAGRCFAGDAPERSSCGSNRATHPAVACR